MHAKVIVIKAVPSQEKLKAAHLLAETDGKISCGSFQAASFSGPQEPCNEFQSQPTKGKLCWGSLPTKEGMSLI